MGRHALWLRIALLAIISVLPATWSRLAAAAQDRVALVVGNSNYRNAPRLPTPANDAEDIAATLGRLGFEVVLRKDATAEELRSAIRSFAEKSSKAKIALAYFAGYSINVGVETYLVPTDAALKAANSFRTETIPLSTTTAAAAEARTLGVLVLDAMRGNPFAMKFERLGPQSEPDAPPAKGNPFRNVLVYFATEPGATTEEGAGRNSPLAAALLKYLAQPDLEISFLFRNVRDEVRKATGYRQTPFMYGQLSSEKIYLNTERVRLEAGTPGTHACDELAAAPEDRKSAPSVKGIKLEDINIVAAIAGCSDAVAQFPGVSRFQYQLGRAYFAAKDYPSALANYKRAYELGNPQALYALGSMYDDGKGVEKDPARARFYYEISAETKFAPAIVRLGLHYELGSGVAKDLAQAFSFYQRAADLGDPQALNRVGLFVEKGIATKINLKRARDLYERAANLGDQDAMINLARCFAGGIGGRQDAGETRRWLEKAASAGSIDAKQILARYNTPKN